MAEPQPLTLTALHATGFQVSLQVSSLEAVDATIAQLIQLGYRPAGAGDGWMRTPEGLPLCPKHGAVMRARLKQGDSWHSHSVITKSGEELYCRGFPGKSSPGWDVPA